MSTTDRHIYEFGPYRFDSTQGILILRRDGRPVPLTPKSTELLRALVEAGGRLLTKGELLKRVWADVFIEEGTLHRHISFLRRALTSAGNGSQYIETVPKRGYRFIASACRLRAQYEKSAFAPADPLRFGAGEASETEQEREYALAVLPFANATPDPEAEYLSDGVTESIINDLAQLKGLTVMAGSTVFRYKGREIEPREAGRELGVDGLVAGKVLRLEGRLVIRAALIRAADGAQLWGAQFDRAPSDILAVQEEIAREISGRLRLRLTSADGCRLRSPYTENAEAYALYLKGRYFSNKLMAKDLEKAVRSSAGRLR